MAELSTLGSVIKTAYEGQANTNAFTTAEKSKLGGIATGATANSPDATLLARANHTGPQAASTISDFSEAVDDRVASLLMAGSNVTLTYDDAAGTLTIAASGGGASISDGDKGDIVVSSGGTAWSLDPARLASLALADSAVQPGSLGTLAGKNTVATADIEAGAVGLDKLAALVSLRILGRVTAGDGPVEALTPAQLVAILPLVTAVAQGLVPAPGAPTGRVLHDDLTWKDVLSGGSNLAALTSIVPADKIIVSQTSAAGEFKLADLSEATKDLGLDLEYILVPLGDETTAHTTGAGKYTFRLPFAMSLTDAAGAPILPVLSLNTAPTGAAFVVDINEGGVSILSTKLSVDATETTSTTAATPAVLSDTALADGAILTFDIDTIGSTIAGAGAKVLIAGRRV